MLPLIAGIAAASVAIDPAPFRGVLPLPVSALKSAAPVIAGAQQLLEQVIEALRSHLFRRPGR